MQMEVERTLKQLPEIAYVYSKTGTAEVASDPMPPNVSDTFIILNPREEWPDPDLPKAKLIEKIQEAVAKLPGNNYEFTQPIEMRFNELISGVKSDLAIKVYGDNFEVMQKKAQEIANVLNSIPGAADVKVEQVDGLPVLDIRVDREKASLHGLNVSDALEVISIAIGGGKAGLIFEGDRRFDLIVKLPDAIREDLEALSHLPIPSPHQEHSKTQPVSLGEIATLNVADGLNEISRENSKRFISVEANVRGKDLGSFVEAAKKEIDKKVSLADGYWLAWGGQFENLMSARHRLFLAIPLCFSLIFILLYTALNSLKYAFLVFTGVPLALTGGTLALWLRDMPFSITAAVGFIALSGIAVLNGLVLVTYINQLRQEGKELSDAIMQGALTRLRPVLMTALVASLGFIPMALATGTGAEVQKPLATVVIGGLISSTLLTLLVLPALYQIFSSPLPPFPFWRRRELVLQPIPINKNGP
jgi:cobalt-zinc-cadmium resistance protein CzcA